jgi:ABC-type amino acid transport/signal transduction systems, periplasmic component/domain
MEIKRKDLLEAIREKGEITIAMEGTWSPWTYHNEKDELVGFDVEVGRYIANYIGVEAKFVEGEWDGLFAGLDSGMYDIIINGVDETPERAEKYDFSDPYAYIRTALVVRSDNKNIKTFEDLKGKTTANSIGSTYMELAEKYGATVKGVDSLGETMSMVISKRADATLNAEPSVLDYMKEQPDAPIRIVALTEDANHVCIPVRKGEQNAALREEINKALAAMREDGTLKQLSEKYFGSDITNG